MALRITDRFMIPPPFSQSAKCLLFLCMPPNNNLPPIAWHTRPKSISYAMKLGWTASLHQQLWKTICAT